MTSFIVKHFSAYLTFSDTMLEDDIIGASLRALINHERLITPRIPAKTKRFVMRQKREKLS